MILQQTRIQYALPKIERFFEAFPNLSSLASANEEEVLVAFKGLGYYDRARNLQKGAKVIIEEHSGDFPQDYEELLKIPSIGPYTAAMIGSICFHQKRAAIDGNIKRVFARYLMLGDEMGSNFFGTCREFANQRLGESEMHPGVFNEALMELGQKLCLKHNPKCLECPLQGNCLAFKQGRQDRIPVKRDAGIKKDVLWLNFLINHRGGILLQKDPQSYFLKGQWILPSFLFILKENKFIPLIHRELPDPLKRKLKKYSRGFFKNIRSDQKPYSRHTITDHNIKLYREEMKSDGRIIEIDQKIIFCPKEKLPAKLVSNAMLKVL